MKIKLLKALPGAEVGEIYEHTDGNLRSFYRYRDGIKEIPYIGRNLVSMGWAEEVKEEEVWVPKIGETFFFIGDGWCMNMTRTSEDGCEIESFSKCGLIKKTHEEAKKRLLFLELSNSNGGFVPKFGELYFAFMPDCIDSALTEIGELRANHVTITNGIAMGNCYKTREQAEKYAPKWKEYFDLLK